MDGVGRGLAAGQAGQRRGSATTAAWDISAPAELMAPGRLSINVNA